MHDLNRMMCARAKCNTNVEGNLTLMEFDDLNHFSHNNNDKMLNLENERICSSALHRLMEMQRFDTFSIWLISVWVSFRCRFFTIIFHSPILNTVAANHSKMKCIHSVERKRAEWRIFVKWIKTNDVASNRLFRTILMPK